MDNDNNGFKDKAKFYTIQIKERNENIVSFFKFYKIYWADKIQIKI